VAISFIGGGHQSTRRKPPTCCKSLTNFIMLYRGDDMKSFHHNKTLISPHLIPIHDGKKYSVQYYLFFIITDFIISGFEKYSSNIFAQKNI